MNADASLVSFELGLEFESLAVPPAQTKGKLYFIVGETLICCDQLLCDAGGKLKLFTEVEWAQLFTPAEAAVIGSASTQHYLGQLNGYSLWAAVIDRSMLRGGFQWSSLRPQLELIGDLGFALAGRALQVAQWYYDHRFCGRCAQPTTVDFLDRARVCPNCNLRFYPRISPCMIVLVTRGDEILLAHHARASRPVYSTLAGFVEPGERAEDTVHREIKEEVGITVTHLEYFSSQPWPFPNQLMLGFFAAYQAGEIKVDGIEILDARWFRYDQLPQVPAKASVAGRLIAHYVELRRKINLE